MSKPLGATPKRQRKRLAKAELLVLLACKCEQWANDIGGKAMGVPRPRLKPFEEWGDDDPFVDLAQRYQLTPLDLERLLTLLADQLEERALRAGYEEAWIDVE